MKYKAGHIFYNVTEKFTRSLPTHYVMHTWPLDESKYKTSADLPFFFGGMRHLSEYILAKNGYMRQPSQQAPATTFRQHSAKKYYFWKWPLDAGSRTLGLTNDFLQITSV